MKKFAKMSLAAAVAVAGLTSYSSAADLEEAIKGVDISGMVRYRLNSTDADTAANSATSTSTETNDYDIELTAKVPVNDMVKAVVKFDVSGDRGVYTSNDDTAKHLTMDIEDAYFQFSLPYATVMVGQQNVPGPFVDDEEGTGIVGLIPAGPVTFAAGYFNSIEAISEDAYEVGILGSFEPVSFAAWYLNIQDYTDVWNIDLAATLGPVTLHGSYADKDMEADNLEYESLILEAELDLDVVTLNAGYGASGKNGSAEVTDTTDAKVSDFGGEIVDITTADIDIWTIGVSGSPMDKVTLGLEYFDGDTDTNGSNDDYNEIKFSAKYQMSKNFAISGWYADGEAADVDTTKSRLEMKYSF